MPFQPKPNTCPVCQEGRAYSFVRDARNGFGAFSLYECNSCKTQFWLPFKNLGAQWYEKRGGYAGAKVLKPALSRGYHKEFFSLHSSLKGKSVLDVGCGAGEFLAKVQERGGQAWGFDFDALAIAAAKKHFHLEYVYAMPLEDFVRKIKPPQFDMVTCFEVIEHVDNPRELVGQMAGILKPGGILVLSTPSRERLAANFNVWDFPPNHLTRWNKESLENIFGPFGFEMSSLRYVEGFRFLLEAMNGRFRFGMMKKAQKGFVRNETANSFFIKFLSISAVIKEYFIGGIPAFLLWTWSVFSGRKNGTMFAEFQRVKQEFKKKVIFFIPTLAQGGGERVVSELSLHLPKTIERKIVLFENKIAYPYEGELIMLGVPISLNFFLRGLYFFVRLFKFKKVLLKENPDYVVSFGAGANMINLLLNSKKAIVRVDNFFSKNNAGFWRGMYSIFIRLFFNRAQKIVAVSQVAANDLVKNFGVRREKIKVIYNPVDAEKIQKLSQEPLSMQYEKLFQNPVITTMGRLTKQKGQWHLIKAFKKFKETVPGAQLVILGEGELKEPLQKLAKDTGVADSVHFLGWQKNPFPFLRASKFFVLSSLWEGLPTVLLEAMACGLLVISSDCKSGPREILAPSGNINAEAQGMEVAEFGILVPALDEKFPFSKGITKEEQALAEAMEKLHTDPLLLENLKRKAQERAEDFRIDRILKEWDFLSPNF